MKKIIFLLTYIIVTVSAVAQSNVRLNNFWGNMYYINPASIYDKYQAVFNMSAQKQWLGIEGAPTTFYASGITYLDAYHTQLGLALIQDKIGYTSISNINFSYAYAIPLEYDWQIHFGVGANYQSISYDISKVSIANGNDPMVYDELRNEDGFNADLGVELTNKSLKLGMASQNIASIFSQGRPLQTNTNFVYAKYKQNSNDIVNLGAGICGIQYADIYQLEMNMTSYFKFNRYNGLLDKPDLFDIGTFYRTGSEAGVILGFNVGDAIHLSYSYDYHFGALGAGSYGTNEITITYNLARKPMCHNCWY
jgi:type IX secretion system PorP/SprF family membrane protein